ncbi:hypothetical protein TraAM80_08455 [Trypanosoma rangeli]|uniref:Uncharacterized protein n=1 Tax=Trypanosoma rangeli TaxID=5698 RepID=A0A3R7JYR2_TRYRA|nr:uncharacterized protein TraAM80_08455 [Trypanosoma rangeli]RNE99014.1 hypothetical protein TraAM80_08455 [Trypanosoma rangeli]|eukprot:RNE99014.1 hypothetical protein TraAM80_08455 [Trypanosoma rangeli]
MSFRHFDLTRTGSLLFSLRVGDCVCMLIYGQGSALNRTSDVLNAVLFAEVCDARGDGEWAFFNFLILRFMMTQGRYTYANNTSYSTCSGFELICDSHNHCCYASGSVCVGLPDDNNCAKCLAREALKKV